MKKTNKKRVVQNSVRIFCIGCFLFAFGTAKAQFASPFSPTNYTIEVDVTVTAQSIGFLFGGTTTGNLYMWQLNCQTADHFRLRPHIRRNGGWPHYYDVDASTVVSEATKNAPHRLKIEVRADTIISSLDGTLLDTIVDASFLKGRYGRMGLRASTVANDHEGGNIDNLIVKDDKGTILYANDFEVSATDFPDCEIVDGKLQLRSGKEFALKNGTWTGRYSYETDFKALAGEAGVVFAALDNDNLYMWQYSLGTPVARLRPHTRLNGQWSCFKEIDLGHVIPAEQNNAEHHMKVDVDGANFITYIDGVKVDSTYMESLGFGNFGYRFGSTDGIFDNLLVKDGTGKILYQNDFNSDPPFNFPQLVSVEGKLQHNVGANEFQLYTKSPVLVTGTFLTPLVNGKTGDVVSVRLMSHAEYDRVQVPIHFQVNGGVVVTEMLASLPSFTSKDYTFAQTMTTNNADSKDTIKVWIGNDTISTVVTNSPVTGSVSPKTSIFELYPTRTSGLVYIQLKDVKEAVAQVYDLAGILVKSVSLKQADCCLDLSDLSNGIYFIRLTSGKVSQLAKVVKN